VRQVFTDYLNTVLENIYNGSSPSGATPFSSRLYVSGGLGWGMSSESNICSVPFSHGSPVQSDTCSHTRGALDACLVVVRRLVLQP
jgi:hypothetical protein